jgi:hypothetical protein
MTFLYCSGFVTFWHRSLDPVLWIRILVLMTQKMKKKYIWDPDPEIPLNPDPIRIRIGSGSITLLRSVNWITDPDLDPDPASEPDSTFFFSGFQDAFLLITFCSYTYISLKRCRKK